MDSDLKEYLSYFKKNSEKQPKKTTSVKLKEVTGNRASSNSDSISTTTVSLSEELSPFASSLQKRFNLHDVSGLQVSHNTTSAPLSSVGTPDDDSTDGIGKLVLSLKDLRPSEDTINSNSDLERSDTSSFNIKANVFAVDDLIAEFNDDDDNAVDKSVASDVEIAIGKSYEDDFEEEEEEEDSQGTGVPESVHEPPLDEVTEELASVDTVEDYSEESGREGVAKSTSANVTSSSVDHVRSGDSYTEDTSTLEHSSASQEAEASSLSKHEAAVQTDLSWKLPGGLDYSVLDHDPIPRSEAGTMALHNLVTQQLQLTRSLIETAQLLHHNQTSAIRPDHHYTTLEDTKQFIESHKPKVLKMKKK